MAILVNKQRVSGIVHNTDLR